MPDALKQQYKRTRAAISAITEASCERPCRERLYLSNSSEIVYLMKVLKLIKLHPWVQEVEGEILA